jgi:hypothetical protein
MSFNFKNNLIALSENKEYNESIKEWQQLTTLKKSDGRCVCNAVIKNIIYYRNVKTFNIITSGSSCTHKFLKIIKKAKENKINKKIINHINSIEYLNIDDLIKYSKECEIEYIKEEEELIKQKQRIEEEELIKQKQRIEEEELIKQKQRNEEEELIKQKQRIEEEELIKQKQRIEEFNKLNKCYQCKDSYFKKGMIAFSCGYCKLKFSIK